MEVSLKPNYYRYEEQKLIENSISLLVVAADSNRINKKPFVLHSIRVATYLMSKSYPVKLVIAAVLHDILEDTHMQSHELETSFGSGVRRLVEANTFDASIRDTRERYTDLFNRCFAEGRDATIIKAVDLLDNSHFYNGDKALIDKFIYFVEQSRVILDRDLDSEIIHDLAKRAEELSHT